MNTFGNPVRPYRVESEPGRRGVFNRDDESDPFAEKV
jgi:hypothetical protein